MRPSAASGAAAQPLELVRVADGDRRLRGEEREQLEVVLPRLDAGRASRSPARRPGRAVRRAARPRSMPPVGAAAAIIGAPLSIAAAAARLERLPGRRRRARARHRDEPAALELEHHAALGVGGLHGGLGHGVQHARHTPDEASVSPTVSSRSRSRAQRRAGERARDLRAQLVAHEGLGEVVEGAALDRLHRRLDGRRAPS